MKNSKVILTVLILCALTGAVVTGYFLLKSMQTNINDLSVVSQTAAKNAEVATQEVIGLKSAHAALLANIATVNEDMQNLTKVVDDKDSQIAQVKNEQSSQATELLALRARADKFDADTKAWQVDYIKVVIGMEEKINIKNKQLQEEIEALTQAVKALPVSAALPVEKNKK